MVVEFQLKLSLVSERRGNGDTIEINLVIFKLHFIFLGFTAYCDVMSLIMYQTSLSSNHRFATYCVAMRKLLIHSEHCFPPL